MSFAIFALVQFVFSLFLSIAIFIFSFSSYGEEWRCESVFSFNSSIVSLTRMHLAARLGRSLNSGGLDQEKSFVLEDSNRELFEVGKLIVFSDKYLRWFLESMHLAGVPGHEARKRAEGILLELAESIGRTYPLKYLSIHELNFRLSFRLNREAKRAMRPELLKIGKSEEQIIFRKDMVVPKEYESFQKAPKAVQKFLPELQRFFVVNGEKKSILPFTQIDHGIYVTTAHAFEYWKLVTGLEKPVITDSEGTPYMYEIIKMGVPAEDRNLGPEFLPTQAINDLVVLRFKNLGANSKIPETALAQPGEDLYYLTQPKLHVFIKTHFQLPFEGFLSASGHLLQSTQGLYVIEMISHTGASGYPVLNAKGEVIGIIWGNQSFRRLNNLGSNLRKVYADDLLFVEREVTYVIPIQAVYSFAEVNR